MNIHLHVDALRFIFAGDSLRNKDAAYKIVRDSNFEVHNTHNAFIQAWLSGREQIAGINIPPEIIYKIADQITVNNKIYFKVKTWTFGKWYYEFDSKHQITKKSIRKIQTKITLKIE